MQRTQRAVVAVPEPAAGAADVPVRQIVDEPREQRAGALGVEVVHRRGDVAYESVRLRREPAIEYVPVGERRRLRGRRPARRTRVQDMEGDGVPVRQQHLADDLLQRRVPDAAGLPR